MARKMMKPAMIVSTSAITGDSRARADDRSGRRINSMRNPAPVSDTRHHQPDLVPRDGMRVARRRQAAVRDHRRPVGNLEDLIEILADHEYSRAGPRQIDQRLPNGRRGPGIHAPGRLAHNQYTRLPVYLAPNHELLQIAARQRS